MERGDGNALCSESKWNKETKYNEGEKKNENVTSLDVDQQEMSDYVKTW